MPYLYASCPDEQLILPGVAQHSSSEDPNPDKLVHDFASRFSTASGQNCPKLALPRIARYEIPLASIAA